MQPVENRLAFAASPLALTARTSAFHGVCSTPTHTDLHRVVTKRYNRARIVSLGATPAPPSKEPEEDKAAGSQPEDAAVPDAEDAEEEKPVEEVTADDILNSPTFLKKKMELVQKELIAAKKKLDASDEEMNDEKQRYVRLSADFENYRRRGVEDLNQQDAKSTAKVCKEILSVLDNFERATAALELETDKEKAIAASFGSINTQLLDALAKLDVEPVDAVGDVFDPEFHEAIQRMESTEYVADVVCQQFTRGFKIGDTLIRASVVAVSSGPGPEDAAEEPVEAIDVDAEEAGDKADEEKS